MAELGKLEARVQLLDVEGETVWEGPHDDPVATGAERLDLPEQPQDMLLFFRLSQKWEGEIVGGNDARQRRSQSSHGRKPSMLRITSRDSRAFVRGLKKYAKKTAGDIARGMLNDTAFHAMKKWKVGIGDEMILRNSWTLRNVGVTKARGRDINRMFSVTGNRLDYMATQETGGVKTEGGKYGGSLPTPYASGERGVPRKRTVRAANKVESIKLTSPALGRFPTKRQKIAVGAAMALRSGNKYVFLNVSKETRGIHKVFKRGGKRRTTRKGRGRKQFKMRMVWSMSHGHTKITPSPTLARAKAVAVRRMGHFAVKQIAWQLRKNVSLQSLAF